MKNRILAIVATAGVSLAAVNGNAQELSGSISTAFESEYVFRGVQLAKESMQASVDVSYGDAYAGLWTNQPIDDVYGYSNEVDIYAGYGLALDDTFNLDFGLTSYLYPDDDSADATTEAFLAFSADVYDLSPTLTAYYDFDLEALTLELSASYTYTIDDKNSIVVGAAAGWVNEQYDSEYSYFNVSGDYVYKLSDAASLSVGGRVGGNNDHRGIKGHETTAWGGVAFKYGY